MKKLYLVQLLLRSRTELQNYAYYNNYKEALRAVNYLNEDPLIDSEYIRIKEIYYYV